MLEKLRTILMGENGRNLDDLDNMTGKEMVFINSTKANLTQKV